MNDLKTFVSKNLLLCDQLMNVGQKIEVFSIYYYLIDAGYMI